jgi:hypothetical protein
LELAELGVDSEPPFATRRDALKLAALGPLALGARPSLAPPRSGRRAGCASGSPVSTYSYWHFEPTKFPVQKVIEQAAGLGFDGVELLHRQMTARRPEYLNSLKQLAFKNGLSLPMLSIHQDSSRPTRPSA